MTIWRVLAFLLLLLTAACGDDCDGAFVSNQNGLLVFVGCGSLVVPATPTHAGR